MSRIEPDLAIPATLKFADVTEQAMASLKMDAIKRERNGYAVIGGAMNYGESSLGDGLFGKISHGAKLFCIAFALLAPNLLFIKYVL